MTSKEITPRQMKILQFIRDYMRCESVPPTYREIASHMGIKSTHGVARHLRALEAKGQLELIREKARGIRLPGFMPLAEGPPPETIPLLGRVAAGMPILAEENVEERLYIDRTVFGPGATFALKVSGDSMKNAGMMDGDLVVIRTQPTAKNGEIVVALIGEEATVKRFYDCGSHVELRPENPDYAVISVAKSDPEGLMIVGLVVGLLRRY